MFIILGNILCYITFDLTGLLSQFILQFDFYYISIDLQFQANARYNLEAKENGNNLVISLAELSDEGS